MTAQLSPPKIVLLAVHFATKSDVASLTALAVRHDKVLQRELLLRILLTCLPETADTSAFIPLIQRFETNIGDLEDDGDIELSTASVDDFTDAEAARKVRKLRLLPLAPPNVPAGAADDPVAQFLISRAQRVDEGAGLLTQLPTLIVPFLDYSPCIRTWMISALLPLLRRNYEYYPDSPIPLSLLAFEQLNDRAAVSLLLEQTGVREEDLPHIGRDLRGLVGPWFYNDSRWRRGGNDNGEDGQVAKLQCPGWEQMLEWLLNQAAKSWTVAVKAVEQWDGPADVDLGGFGSMWLEDEEQGYLESRYARAVLATAYLIPEASVEALVGVNNIITKVMTLLGEDPFPTLQVASSLLAPLADAETESLVSTKNATYMRNDMLEEANVLTAPRKSSAQVLHALALSAFILTKAGVSCNIRRAGELAFLQDEREQKSEALQFIGTLSTNAPKSDDKFWIRVRNELLWLRDWGAEEAAGSSSPVPARGVFGRLQKEFIEVECLKAFLASGRRSRTTAFDTLWLLNHDRLLPGEVDL